MLSASLARTVATDAVVDSLLAQHTPICIGVSGGKDSQAVALAVARHLEQIGHRGPRLLVHADLGRVEWRDSMGVCERLAAHLGWELLVVRRPAGDLLHRWESRWVSRRDAYAELLTVRLTPPWSTPSMRFCTSELKTDPIGSALRKRFLTGPIISVDGVRAQESAARAKKTISSPAAKLSRKDSVGLNWHAILPWSVEDVFAEIAAAGLAPHEAYTVHGSSRVSCGFCIMGSLADLEIAAGLPEHHELYLSMVDLECRSTFAFQGARWLGSIAPLRLTPEMRVRLEHARVAAAARVEAEKGIPPHLLFRGQGWPESVPSFEEAEHLANIRRRVAQAVGIDIQYTDAASVRQRFEELASMVDAKLASA